MRVMTYNIFEGGAMAGLEAVAEVILAQSPDVLCLQEAIPLMKTSKLQSLVGILGLENYVLPSAGSTAFPVATLSRFPILNYKDIRDMRNGCLVTYLETPIGKIAVANVHLHPQGEEFRVRELKRILAAIRRKSSLIVGDLNSLSKQDNYSQLQISRFPTKQREKFCIQGKVQYCSTDLLRQQGYVDVAVAMRRNKISTTPTPTCHDPAHAGPLRIDYVWVSEGLAGKLNSYRVIRSEKAGRASDHYPIMVDLK